MIRKSLCFGRGATADIRVRRTAFGIELRKAGCVEGRNNRGFFYCSGRVGSLMSSSLLMEGVCVILRQQENNKWLKTVSILMSAGHIGL